MTVSLAINLGAAALSMVALAVTVWQATSARDQAKSARDQVAEARAQRELAEQVRRDASQPYVWVDFRMDPGHAFLVRLHLENNGPTVARNVRVTIDPPLPHLDQDWDLKSYQAFTNGFPALPPGRAMEWNIASGPTLLNADVPQRYRVTVSGEGPFGPMEPLTYDLGLPEWHHVEATPPGTLHEVKKAIADVGTELAHLRQEHHLRSSVRQHRGLHWLASRARSIMHRR